jgi:GNAT superfamily N-acetyltransferase
MYQQVNIEILPWDSDFFGYLVGRCVFSPNDDIALLLPRLLDQAQRAQLRLLYVYTPVQPSTIETMETNGGLWVDRKVFLCRALENNAPLLSTQRVREYNLPYPTAGLESLALLSGSHSRFCRDKHFRNREFERLYCHWIAQCLKSTDTQVWICGSEHQPEALLALRLAPPTAYVELIAVTSSEWGRGIGKQLMHKAYACAREAGCRYIRLNTQYHNWQAMHFYKKEGFQIEKENYVFHFWFSE